MSLLVYEFNDKELFFDRRYNAMIFLAIFLACSQSSECPGKNTFIDKDGMCSCIEGMPFGDPYSDIGCFNCNKTCHAKGECVDSDICSCMPGYVGDGIISCIPHFPLPISANPSSCAVNDNAEIVITLENDTSSHFVFCKFGTTMVSGELLTNRTMKCLAPVGESGNVELRVSDDSNDWNLPGIEFAFIDNQDNFMQLIIPIITVLSILCIVIVTVKCMNKANMFPVVTTDEEIPLMKSSHADLSMHGFSPL